MIELLIAHFVSAGMTATDARRYAHSLNLMLPGHGNNGSNASLLENIGRGLLSASRELRVTSNKGLDPSNYSPPTIQWIE